MPDGERTGVEHAIAVIEGVADASDHEWIRRGLELALCDGVPFEVALRLPATPARRRAALAAFWIGEAAREIDAALPWQRAIALDSLARDFERRQWPRWRALRTPPAGASAAERALFYLARHGGRVPRARRLHDLLATATVGQDIAAASAESSLHVEQPSEPKS